ncbi:MAG: aldehyde dehydrogenase family protein [Proteobacteria bacterium]|jgi:aldehyde dehydrogenase (NAD+)|nr:aldehyde dehydrogenase family protein [Pseudomonadota bacterium]
MQLAEVFELQKKQRWINSQSSAEERIKKIRKLKSHILKYELDLKKAMYMDFKKPAYEVELTEIYPPLEEIQIVIKNLKQWMEPQAVATPLALLGTRSEVHFEARGQVLVMAPWNYPFQLLFIPLISALAAGNTVILRSSERVPETNKVMMKIIAESFSPEEVFMAPNTLEAAEELLKLPFDHIFFTGSTRIGKKVMSAAAEHLSTVTLELGGKSPALVMPDAHLDQAVERITWGKFLNAGQTCVCADYVLVHESIYEKFCEKLADRVHQIYGAGEKALTSPDFARVIEDTSWGRLQDLTERTLAAGAKSLLARFAMKSEKFISPTLLGDVKTDHPIMESEIFGPVLPILQFKDLEEALQIIQSRPKPLAVYVFTRNERVQKQILRQTSSGGAVMNHLIVHLGNPHLPFGGVGYSGQGSYHGFSGFRTFSHERSVLHQGFISIGSFIYPPYSGWKARFALKFLRWLVR